MPNATTRKAIAELEAGKGKRFARVDDLMADLHTDDRPHYFLDLSVIFHLFQKVDTYPFTTENGKVVRDLPR